MKDGDWSGWLLNRSRQDDSQQRAILDRLLDIAEVRPGYRVLDLGAGHGALAFAAARRVGRAGQVVCVDAGEQVLQEAQRRAEIRGLANVEFIVADAAILPLEPGSLDAAASKSLLYVLSDHDKVLAEVFRVLRDGGRLALFEPLLRWESIWQTGLLERLAGMLEAAGHPAFRLNAGEMMRAVEEAGFRQVQVFTWHADVTRRYASAEEALSDWRDLLPGELSLIRWWSRAGMPAGDLREAAESLARESIRPGWRDLLPCIFLGATKPAKDVSEGA